MKKVIVTGANGSGKSHFAARLAEVRPDIPIISFDTIKLKTGWQQKSKSEIQASLAEELDRSAWILEGGPSLLTQALPHADALIWLDPPDWLRALRLAQRPWKFIGRTRPELPDGNVDWPLQQYGFALKSLRRSRKFRQAIAKQFETSDLETKARCRSKRDHENVLGLWLLHGQQT